MKVPELRITEPLKAFDIQKKFNNLDDILRRLPIHLGNGSPEGIVSAPIGSIYLRFDGGAGTTLYVKESGVKEIGWVGK